MFNNTRITLSVNSYRMFKLTPFVHKMLPKITHIVSVVCCKFKVKTTVWSCDIGEADP